MRTLSLCGKHRVGFFYPPFSLRLALSALIKTVFFGSLLSLLMLVGCDNSTGSQATDPVGTWTGKVSDSTFTLVIKGDATFSALLPDPNGTYQISGTYTLQGNTITLTYASGFQVIGIPPPHVNPANGTINGKTMKIQVPYHSDTDSTTLTKK